MWVEGNQYQPSLFLNEYLLSVGAVGLNPNDLNLRYVAQLNAAAQTGLKLKNPPNWWQQCAKQVIVQSGDSVVEPELIYDKDCPIKGNIAGSKKNPKLTYHTPLSGWYKRIKYEQCFETEAEAQTAGFIKVK